MKKIEEYVRSIPDFPEPGIILRDITTVLQDADGLQLAIQSMQDCLKDTEVDVIAGTDVSYTHLLIAASSICCLTCLTILFTNS